MKLSEKMIRIGLILLILLSFYLSYVIWLSPSGRTGVDDNQNSGQIIASTANLRKASEIFLPLRLSWIDGTDIKQTNVENFIARVQTLIDEGEYGTVTTKTYENDDEFAANSDIHQGIEMSYVAAFLLSDYAKMFDLKIDLKEVEDGKDVFFTKVQIDLEKQKIRFVNYKRHQIHEASLKLDQEKLELTLLQSKTTWWQMSGENRLLSRQYNTQEPIKLKMYSYISSSQSYSVFRDAFFTTPEGVKSNDDSQDLVLYDGSENMTVQEDQQIVDFRGDIKPSDDTSDIYSLSFNYVSRLGTNLGNLRYFDRDKESVNYRIFVEGFPVFSDDYRGEVNVSVSEKESDGTVPIQIYSSLDTIQIPIPSDREIELPTSETILNNLINYGAKKDNLRAVIIGYQRQDLKDTSNVVDLMPMWYVKYDTKWYSYDELFSKLEKGEL